ncbi:uncharacterized protein ATC70_005825 [Mucor velutinosus]|uniref:Uncharacterized protein n=1 Tax=Mucor velutinosus TaxID=708070 RepID=A0AAN7DAZ9_9FUNG|nr:hypothetical protein ATC70_005825 [Mucor velutinosus]
MTRAIARQDEALEDLIRSTRQVIRKHSTHLAYNNDNNNYSFHRRRSYSNHKPRLQPPAPPPAQPPQCSHHCCESIAKPLPPKTHHHHYVQPHQPPQQPSYQSPHQQPFYPQPFPTKSRTKTWLNKIIPSKLQCETDDEVGLHDLKKKIYKQKPKPQLQQQQLPYVKTTGRPMIIFSMSPSPEKVVVIDVSANTTVILRSLDADDPNSK